MNNNQDQNHEALWQCDHCSAWWGSQPYAQPTRFMLELPIEQLTALGWDNFRGWRLGNNPNINTCPVCANEVSQPSYGAVSPEAQPQESFATILAPVLLSAN
ncbi:hypothetical protein [Candidatus Leptofilum sp.]|uniref:hypothetical protein n=1 Tax=Candidatus Leptofilum sp. TaxID=3241576 RepID=UPI003B5A2F46